MCLAGKMLNAPERHIIIGRSYQIECVGSDSQAGRDAQWTAQTCEPAEQPGLGRGGHISSASGSSLPVLECGQHRESTVLRVA